MLERGFILPNYDFKKPNENIPFAKWHLKVRCCSYTCFGFLTVSQVPITQRPWPQGKRFASVNNFGFGGTNSHVVLEKAPYIAQNSPELSDLVVQNKKLFVLSANDKIALEGMMKNVGIYLEQRPEVFQSDLMSNVAYTLGQRRSLMQWRVAIPASSSFDLIQALNSGKVSPAKEMKPLRIGFVFTGQGAQCARMGWELYQQYPVFQSTLESCDRYLSSLGASFSLIGKLQPSDHVSLGSH